MILKGKVKFITEALQKESQAVTLPSSRGGHHRAGGCVEEVLEKCVWELVEGVAETVAGRTREPLGHQFVELRLGDVFSATGVDTTHWDHSTESQQGHVVGVRLS